MHLGHTYSAFGHGATAVIFFLSSSFFFFYRDRFFQSFDSRPSSSWGIKIKMRERARERKREKVRESARFGRFTRQTLVELYAPATILCYTRGGNAVIEV